MLESDQISLEEKERLTKIYQSLNPAKLKRVPDKKLANLLKIYQKKKGQENINLIKKLSPSMVSFPSVVKKVVLVS